MAVGQSGTIVRIEGGRGVTTRLIALGITPGEKVTKISAVGRSGPVAVLVDRMRIAIGFGMAAKVIVEPESV